MLSLTGLYHNGKIKLEKQIELERPARVIVTFLEEEEQEETAQDELPEPYLTLIAFSTTHPQDSFQA